MNKLDQKSCKIFNDNISWLLSSDIRIHSGKNKGAVYGWKNLNPVSFPFIYSEITGYSITMLSWLYSESGNREALRAAMQSAAWIKNSMRSYLVPARRLASNDPSNISNLFYAFDNGMIMIGLLNLYKITKRAKFLFLAEEMTKTIIDHFFDGSSLTARLDRSYKPVENDYENGEKTKWSTVSGAYHCKLSLGLLELSRLTNNKLYIKVSDSICDYAKKLQRSSGEFNSNTNSKITYIHPHLYACEGLIYSGLTQPNSRHFLAGLKGIKWAIKRLKMTTGGLGLVSDTRRNSPEQSDCTAQLLRLLLLCRSQLSKSLNGSIIYDVIDDVHSRLLDFYVPTGKNQGGMKYQLNLNSICSWCTMFSVQALGLWKTRNSRKLPWIDYFI